MGILGKYFEMINLWYANNAVLIVGARHGAPLRLALLGLACLLASCAQFPNLPYDSGCIGDNRLRVIGVVIGPRPEASPGDTVTVAAYFGGNEAKSTGDIRVSFRMIQGSDATAFVDNDYVTLLSGPSGLPDSCRFSFRLRPDVFMGRQPYDGMPQSIIDSVTGLFAAGPDSVASMLLSLDDDQRITLGKCVEKMAMSAMVLFTVRSENGDSLVVAARLAIKYRIDLPGVSPPNRNPRISWVGVCKVPERFAAGFDFFAPSNPEKGRLRFLYNADNPALCDSVIDIDTGYSYFLVADNGVSKAIDSTGRLRGDTAIETVVDAGGNPTVERVEYRWLYRDGDGDSGGRAGMTIDDDGSACIAMAPPENTARQSFRFWVVAYDFIEDMLPMRPRGMCVRAVSGAFRFSAEYEKAMEERR
jgi:hypothetical protein